MKIVSYNNNKAFFVILWYLFLYSSFCFSSSVVHYHNVAFFPSLERLWYLSWAFFLYFFFVVLIIFSWWIFRDFYMWKKLNKNNEKIWFIKRFKNTVRVLYRFKLQFYLYLHIHEICKYLRLNIYHHEWNYSRCS